VNSGTSTYHTLQTRYSQRLTRQLFILGTYTWSKLERNNITSLVNKSYYHNVLVNYHSISPLDQPHLLRLIMVYTVPKVFDGAGRVRGMLRTSLSGWEISNYYDLESGVPLAITGSNGRPILARVIGRLCLRERLSVAQQHLTAATAILKRCNKRSPPASKHRCRIVRS
jgi:hypothetical protein